MKKIYITFLFAFCFASTIQAQAPPPEFLNEIAIPPLVTGLDDFELLAVQTVHDFNPHDTLNVSGLNGVTTFAFQDANQTDPSKITTILGPTLRWNYKNMLTPIVTNMLDEVTTCHWHGAHVPQKWDGGPYQRIQPGEDWKPDFPVLDKSATLWYHPHAMDLTYKHVQMGMSGIIIVEDPEDDAGDPDDDLLAEIHKILPTDYAVNDFPLVFQTKKFDLADSVTGQMQIRGDFPGFQDNFEYMVNGIIDPYMNVPADMIRLRILNGDAKYAFNFNFDDSNGDDFPAYMIATDAGYMDSTYQLIEILMSPGERTEWLLDLRGLEGDTIYIKNTTSQMPTFGDCFGPPYPQIGIIGDSCTTNGWANDRNLLQLIIGPPSGIDSSIPTDTFPFALHPLETPPLSDVSRVREKSFIRGHFKTNSGKKLFSIDTFLMDMAVVNDTVLLDSTEIWTIFNETVIAHPWHIHDIHFWVTQIIDVTSGDTLNPNDYPEIFKGPKDNVIVMPNWKLSYIATFDDYGTTIKPDHSYMYHCHILPHEDKGMMGTFVVWDPTTSVKEDPDLAAITMKVYPNPSQGILYMHGASEKSSILRFINLNGQLVKEMSLPSFDGAIQLDTDDLPTGMLIMDWQTYEGKAVSKVMITR